MEERDVVKVLQHYRHDLMNNLQIVHGYLSMGKIDKVENKMKECIAFYNEERKLMSLNMPKFALWIIRFNSVYDNFRLTYQLHTENKQLHDYDELLVNRCNDIISKMKLNGDSQELIELHLELQEQQTDPSQIEVTILIKSGFCEQDKRKINEKLMEQIHDIRVNETSNGKVVHFLIPCNT